MTTSTNDPAIVIPILVGAFALAGILAWFIVKAVRAALANSRPYREAMQQAQSDPRVLDTLGSPLQAGPPSGNVRYDLLLGNQASLSIPLSGPNASGRLSVRAAGRWLTWNYTQIQLSVEGREEIIDILGSKVGV